MNQETPSPQSQSGIKPVILVLADTYLPGYLGGGPVRSLANLVDRLEIEFDFKIITTDRDFHASTPYPDVPCDQWTRMGAAQVFYASPEMLAPTKMIRLLRHTSHDLLYVNSFFSPRFSILPLAARRLGWLRPTPMLIAPRGEFSPGAYAIKSWKKKPFVRLAKLARLYPDTHWHATTEHEAEDIAKVIGAPQSRIHIASNLTTTTSSSLDGGIRRECDPLRVCFLSRIARKKNLDFALRVLEQVKAPIDFTIYGPREDAAYWAECEALIARLPNHVRVQVAGAVPNHQVGEVLTQHDLFFLPTRGENFGHVFVEAWSAGLSVLTSDQTPWRGLAERGVGWDVPLSEPKSYVQILEQFSKFQPTELSQSRACCQAFIRESTENAGNVTSHIEMFKELTLEPASGRTYH